MAKSWIEKLHPKGADLPRVVMLDGRRAARLKAHTMLVPSPPMIFELMRRVPEGKPPPLGSVKP